MKAAIYARYSSDLQNDRSIEDQIGLCRRFAAESDWLVADGHIYTDRAVSGASLIGRTGLISLLNEASHNPRPFDYVLVEDTSRLSRRMGEHEEIIDQLHFYGIHVFFVSQGIDSKDQQSHLTVGVNSLLDSQFRHDLKRKTLRGLKGQAERGYNTGSRTYGYRYTKLIDETGGFNYKKGEQQYIGTEIGIDPGQAQVVRQVFDMWTSGNSISEITYWLNERKIPPPGVGIQRKNGRNRYTWIPNTIREILKNTKYVGQWTYNKRAWRRNPKTGQRKAFIRDKKEWVIKERPELAIVDKKTWELAQIRIKASTRGPHSRKGPRLRFLFSGLMKCHICGGSYVVVASDRSHNPIFGCCTNKQRGAAVCPNNFRVRKEELETIILDNLFENYISPPILSAIINKANEKLKSAISRLKKRSGQIHRERDALQEKLKNVLEAIESGGISTAVKKRLGEIEARLEELNQQSRALDQLYDFDKLKIDEEYARNWLENIRKLLEIDLPKARANLFALVGEFTLSPTMIKGIRHLRVEGNVKLEGLLLVASGGKCNICNTGGEIRTLDPQIHNLML
jgi:site-specific DNA recombinase